VLADTLKLLKPGGHLIFSTCTFNDQENEGNAQWLIREFDLEAISLQLPPEWGITKSGIGYQFFPHKTKGEGFYIACFRKKGPLLSSKKKKTSKSSGPWQKISKKDWPTLHPWVKSPADLSAFVHERTGIISILNKSLEERALFLSSRIHKIHIGTRLGELKHRQLVPHADWALSCLCPEDFLAVDMEEAEALLFLKKDLFSPDHIPKGWQLVKHQGYGLGWIKGLGSRVNNYFPNHWRILMKIPKEHVSFWEKISK
jgi:NOL1/NOP2/fmu family ribosome biogenesis protein